MIDEMERGGEEEEEEGGVEERGGEIRGGERKKMKGRKYLKERKKSVDRALSCLL